jgi:hypothetical protein
MCFASSSLKPLKGKRKMKMKKKMVMLPKGDLAGTQGSKSTQSCNAIASWPKQFYKSIDNTKMYCMAAKHKA